MATTKIEESSSSCSSTFIWKIENFSKLDSEGDASDVFSVGNYKWEAVIYPKGMGKIYDHLSLYLRLLNLTEPVKTEFSIAVTSQADRINSVKQGGKLEFRTNDNTNMNGYGGWPNFMRLSELHNPAKGYIVNDTCIIRVEVTCMLKGDFDDDSDEDEHDKVSEVKRCKLRGINFKWNIENFSEINTEYGLVSGVFSAGSFKWKVHIYPKGKGKVYDHLTLFLIPVDSKEPVHAKIKVFIFSQTDCKETKEIEGEYTFTEDGKGLGFEKLIRLSEFHKPAKGYLVNDTCFMGFEVTCGRTEVDLRAQKMVPCKRCKIEDKTLVNEMKN